MKQSLTILFLFLLVSKCFSQVIPKKANAILIKNISFKEMENGLLDQGYVFEKSDSNLQTIKTEFKNGKGKLKSVKSQFYVRIKDSVATLWGECYYVGLLGVKAVGTTWSVDSAPTRIENSGNKNIFGEMNQLAVSFKKPLEYLIQ